MKEWTDYYVIFLEKIIDININLLAEIKNSLEDLKLGLTGALNITDDMEELSTALSFNKVPGTWEKKAYFSKKVLSTWFGVNLFF